tara:strand:- start:839 stop:1828 length:990 start_codon:yes stop_codon:yes gene_type:complete
MTDDPNKNWADMYENISHDSQRFDRDKLGSGYGYVDGTDHYANHKQLLISFLHVPSNTIVSFKAFITAFNDTYSSDWASETVYGRADPIYLFKNTTRKISLAFKVPASSEGDAFENLGRVQKLTQFLYPNYTTLTNPITGCPDAFAQTISQSPLIRLKMFNLLNNHGPNGVAGRDRWDIIGSSGAEKGAFATSADRGLLGVIDNVTIGHNLENEGGFEQGPGVILPKLLDVNLSFSPIHEHAVGWGEDGKFINPAFPYSIDVEGSLPVPASEEHFAQSTTNTANSEANADNQLDPDSSSVATTPPGSDAAQAEEEAAALLTIGIGCDVT